jgi:hypothetical protein
VLARGKAAFARFGLPIGTVRRFHLNLSEVGALVVPRNPSDEVALGDRWAVPNDAMDVFIVPDMTDPEAIGRSPRPGPCAKKATLCGMRAPVVSLHGGDLVAGVTFVHEIGHCLGLEHCKAADCGPLNFMAPGGLTQSEFTAKQVTQMRRHCFVRR